MGTTGRGGRETYSREGLRRCLESGWRWGPREEEAEGQLPQERGRRETHWVVVKHLHSENIRL